jgi:hypothetical protein
MANKVDPTTPSLAYNIMWPRIQKVAALLGGTETMRAMGQTFMPQYPAETDEGYQQRLEGTTLFNMTDLTLNSWVGRPFSDPMVLEDIPSEIEHALSNIDRQGNALSVVARNWFRDALAKGLSHVLVDMPRIQQDDPRTMADDRAEKNAPYWTHIVPENVLAARAIIIDGEEILTHLRILEMSIVEGKEQFTEEEVVKVRELNTDEDGKVTVNIWAQKKEKNQQPVWDIEDTFQMDIPFIPLVTFYTDREDLMVSKSPILDLANVNIRHWVSTSDQNNILTVTRFPMLAVTGLADDEEIEAIAIGPRKILATEDPAGKFYYVEHTGDAIAAGRVDLDDLASQMSNYGAEFLKRKPGSPSATARALDSAESTSPLQDLAIRFQKTLETTIGVMAAWLGVESEATVIINTDFGPEVLEQAALDTLNKMRERGDISRPAFVAEMKRRDIISDHYDADADKAVIEEEAMLGFNDANSGTDDEDDDAGGSADGADDAAGGSEADADN